MRSMAMPRGARCLATAAAAKPAPGTPGRPVPTRLQFIELESLNPLVNLATEEWCARQGAMLAGLTVVPCRLFDRADVASTRTIVVYRNAPCVVMGAHQNLWKEVNVAIARTRGIQLIRRESGGGTVFHDAGNLNYCFMTHRSLFNKAMGSTVLADALAHIGVPATLNARQDVALNDRKVCLRARARSSADAPADLRVGLSDHTRPLLSARHAARLCRSRPPRPSTAARPGACDGLDGGRARPALTACAFLCSASLLKAPRRSTAFARRSSTFATSARQRPSRR